MTLPPKVMTGVLRVRRWTLEGTERRTEPDPAHAHHAGTLDKMVDQVTRSIVFVQKRFPCNEWVFLQGSRLSDSAG